MLKLNYCAPLLLLELINLESLNLDSCKIGDEGLQYLKGELHIYQSLSIVSQFVYPFLLIFLQV